MKYSKICARDGIRTRPAKRALAKSFRLPFSLGGFCEQSRSFGGCPEEAETQATMAVAAIIVLVVGLLYVGEYLYAILVVIVIFMFVFGVWVSSRTAKIYEQERTRAAERG